MLINVTFLPPTSFISDCLLFLVFLFLFFLNPSLNAPGVTHEIKMKLLSVFSVCTEDLKISPLYILFYVYLWSFSFFAGLSVSLCLSDDGSPSRFMSKE